MNVLNNTFIYRHYGENDIPFQGTSTFSFSKISEVVWLCITFMLFVAMGPFSVIAVLYGLLSLATRKNREKMVEPARY